MDGRAIAKPLSGFPLELAVLLHETSTVAVVLNSLRTLFFLNQLILSSVI